MERIYSQDNYNVSYKRFPKHKKRPGRTAQNNEPPINCFICDEKIVRHKVNLVLGNSSSENGFPGQISQLLGDEFLIIVQEDDYLCKHCVTLLNNVDKLEKQLSVAKDKLLCYLKEKYKLTDTTGSNDEKVTRFKDQMKEDSLKDDDIAKQLSELHSGKNDELTVLKCSKCEFHTSDEDKFNEHKSSHVNSVMDSQHTESSNSAFGFGDSFRAKNYSCRDQVKLYKCSICFKIFMTRMKCLEHMKNIHVEDKQLYQSDNCSNGSNKYDNDSVFDSLKSKGNSIKKYHIKNNLFHCNSCLACFDSEPDFNKHKCDFSSFNEHNSSSNSANFQIHSDDSKNNPKKICRSFLSEHENNDESTCWSVNNNIARSVAVKEDNSQDKSSVKKLPEKIDDTKDIRNDADNEGDDEDDGDIGGGEVDYTDDCNDIDSDDSGNESTTDEDDSDDSDYVPRKHVCGNCGFKNDIASLREHFEIRSQRDLICSICGQSFDSYCKLMKHSSGHDIYSKPQTCIYCSDLSVPDLLSLSYHMKKKHLNLIDEKMCNMCKKVFPNLGYLQKHILDKSCSTDDHNETINEDGIKMESSDSTEENDKKENVINESMDQGLDDFSKNPKTVNPFSDSNENVDSQSSFLDVDKNGHRLGTFSNVNNNSIEINSSPRNENSVQVYVACRFNEISVKSYNNNMPGQVITTPEVKKKFNDINKFSNLDKISHKSSDLSCVINNKNSEESFATTREVNDKICGIENDQIGVDESSSLANDDDNEINSTPMDTTESIDFFNNETAVSVIYKCGVCGLKRNSKEELLIHIECHTDESKTLTCNICKMNFIELNDLEVHQKKHCDISLSRLCLYCTEVHHDDLSLKRHIIYNHSFNIKNLYCDLCKKGYSSNINFKRHFVLHHNKNYHCKKCDKNFDFKWKLLKHYCKYHKNNSQCRYCDVMIPNSKELFKHEQSLHLKNDLNLKCYVCCRFFKDKVSLKFHELRHTNDLSLCCDVCELSFGNPEVLNSHINEKHFDKSDLYKCSKCNESFKNYKSFRIHRIYSHEKKRSPYECKLCRMKFTNRSLRAIHKQKLHHERYLFNCNVCHLFNTDKLNSYKRHMHLHLKKYPYHCKKCLKFFTLKSRFLDHKFRVHPSKRLYYSYHKKFRRNNYQGMICKSESKINILDNKFNNYVSQSNSNSCIENKDVNSHLVCQPSGNKINIR